MKPEDMIGTSLRFAAYCYEAADRCRDHVHHREHFLSLAKKWEQMAHNLERDIKILNESRVAR
jgi:hypothetical protein